MGIKDLFEKPQQILTSENAEDLTKDKVESEEALDVRLRTKEEFVPYIDFASASNFAFYGSAEKYYDDAIKTIYREYPYDGSRHELEEYNTRLNYLTRHVFENLYPRTTGYVTFGKNQSYAGSHIGSYGPVSTREYIRVYGGPHTGSHIQHGIMGAKDQPLHKIFNHANKLEEDPYAKHGLNKSSNPGSRLSNLRFSPAEGMTVEFWLHKSAVDAANTPREVIFDLWNGNNNGHPQYGRFLVELRAAALNPIRVSLLSGSSTTLDDVSVAPANWATSNVTTGWNHYAISVSASATVTTFRFYQNGDLLKTTSKVGVINEVTGSGKFGGLRATLGALQSHTHRGGTDGYGALSGSLDEFRYWTSTRTSEQIGRNWFTQVRGGTNNEPYNTSLGVYFKFNEGITKDNTTDARVLDYSGRLSNGQWFGYPGHAYGARKVGSAMVDSSAASTEYKDPIIYKDHPEVIALTAKLKASGSHWDEMNNSSMINSIPDFIRESDMTEGDGSLHNIVQLMGSYFDKIQHLITALPKVRATSYLTSSAKPYPFATHLLESVGMNVPQLFVQANVLESIAARDEDRDYVRDISEVKNLIYQNIYNNLLYIYKSKGTEKSIRNLVRCFGVDEELIRLNLYSTNTTYELKQNTRTKTVKRKYINFNDVDKFAANVYQWADPSNPNTTGYIAGTGVTTVTASLGNEELLGMTTEADVVFPLKLTRREKGYFETPFVSASLFGMHSSDTSTLTVPSPDYSNFQVCAVRPSVHSEHVYFVLTSSAGILPELSSSLFLETYNNKRWNISVRIKPSLPVSDFVTGSTINPTYDVHFYGVNIEGGLVENKFHVSGTIEGHTGRNFLRSNKRLYVGAHRENFTGATQLQTDVAISSVKYWTSFLEDADLDSHAKDPENYGVTDPYGSLNLYCKKMGGIRIPKIDTLALNWTFDNVTGPSSDAGDPSTKDSFFYVDDYSSGSAEIVAENRYGWMTPILMKQHSGKGDGFLPPESGDVNPVIVKYISAARQQGPEVLNTSDAVQILRQDDDKFTREHSIIEHYYALEKSMYQTISEEMINMFASVVDFNNLIGEPVNRYRQEYKDLSKLRQLFFERIGNTPDLDRYIEFYKWVDSAVTTAIQQLIPASAEVSEDLHNMVESHVLERNKYWTKFPTIEFKQKDPEAGVHGVHELTYDWKHGHAPLSWVRDVSEKQSDNALFWHHRSIRTDEQLKSNRVGPSGPEDGIDKDRETLRKRIDQHRDTKGTSLANLDGTTYTGRAYALKRFTKPYRLQFDRPREYRSGINFNENKNIKIAQSALQVHGPLSVSSSLTHPPPGGSDITGLPTSVIFVDGARIENFKDVNDNLALKPKRIYKGTAVYARAKEFDQLNNETYAETTLAKGLPAQIVSSSVVTGYNKVWRGIDSPGFVTGTSITNIHNDVYGQDREIPIQGPFTEKYVGGHQSRHVRLNPGTDSFANRPEAWRILLGKLPTPLGCAATDPGAFGFVSQDYPYPNVGRKPKAATGRIMLPVAKLTSGAGSRIWSDLDGQAVTISDGDRSRTFQFKQSADSVSDPSYIKVLLSNLSWPQLADRLEIAITNSDLHIEAKNFTDDSVSPPAAYVELTNTLWGSPESVGRRTDGTKGNVELSTNGMYRIGIGHLTTVDDGGFGMSGGLGLIVLDYHAPKATVYREELVKRPVNIKNILQTTASVDVSLSGSRTHGPIGNYSHNYEIVQTSPRSVNDLYFRKGHAKINKAADTDLVQTRYLLRRPVTDDRNVSWDWKRDVAGESDGHELPDRSKKSGNANKTVIVTRFSAPGGFESMSRGYLDPAHEEYSPNDSVAYRNRRVRGWSGRAYTSGSVTDWLKNYEGQSDPQWVHTGVATDWGHAIGAGPNSAVLRNYRVYDIHGEPRGLREHLARWTARFGLDSVFHPYQRDLVRSPGALVAAGSGGTKWDSSVLSLEFMRGPGNMGGSAYNRPGFHKVHRNRTVKIDQVDKWEHKRVEWGVASEKAIEFGTNITNNQDNMLIAELNATNALRLSAGQSPAGGTAGDSSERMVTIALWVNLNSFTSNNWSTIFSMGGTKDQLYNGSANHDRQPSFYIDLRCSSIGTSTGTQIDIGFARCDHSGNALKSRVVYLNTAQRATGLTKKNAMNCIVVSFNPNTSHTTDTVFVNGAQLPNTNVQGAKYHDGSANVYTQAYKQYYGLGDSGMQEGLSITQSDKFEDLASGEPIFIGGGRCKSTIGQSAVELSAGLQDIIACKGAVISECAIWSGLRWYDIPAAPDSTGTENTNEIFIGDFSLPVRTTDWTTDDMANWLTKQEATSMPNLKDTEMMPRTAPFLFSWWRFGDTATDYSNWDTAADPTDASHKINDFATDPGHVNNLPLYARKTTTDMETCTGNSPPAYSATGLMTRAARIDLVHERTHKNKDKFDNYFVQHGIPRNHDNYWWIHKSVIKPNVLVGLPTASHALQFVSQSNARFAERDPNLANYVRTFSVATNKNHNIPVVGESGVTLRTKPASRYSADFVGLNTLIYEPVFTHRNTLGWTGRLVFNRTGDDPHTGDYYNQYINTYFITNVFVSPGSQKLDPSPYAFHALIHNRQGPYGWPSWKQIRGAQHPIVRNQKKKSEFTYVLPDAAELQLSGTRGHDVLRPRYGDLHYHNRVTAVSSKYLPLRTTIGVSTDISNKFGKRLTRELPVDIQTPYGNEMVYFNEDEINKNLDLVKNKVASYEEVKGMYTRGALETSLSPVTNVKKFEYSEIVWPGHENMYMNDVRQKSEYTNNFWHGEHSHRIANAGTSIHGTSIFGASFQAINRAAGDGGPIYGKSSMWPLDAGTGSIELLPQHGQSWIGNAYGAAARKMVARSLYAYPINQSHHGSTEKEYGGTGEGELVNKWSYPLKDHLGFFMQGSFGASSPSHRTAEAGPLLALPHMMPASSSVASPTQAPLATRSTVTYGMIGKKIYNTNNTPGSGLVNSSHITLGAWGGTSPTYGQLIMPLHDSANWLGYIPLWAGSTAWEAGRLAGKVKDQNLITNRKAREKEIKRRGAATTPEYQFKKAPIFFSQSSSPWTYDYEAFMHKLRVKAKDYSVIPEFRMEDHMDDYIKNKGSNFQSEQTDLFRMVGMPSGSAGKNAANSAEDQFYKVYGTSDFMKHFDILRNDIDEHYEPSTITLRCNAYLKFNPYEGFYPAQRTLQLAKALSGSYGKYIKYTGPAVAVRGSYPNIEAAQVWTEFTSSEDFYGCNHATKPMNGDFSAASDKLAFRNFITPLYAPGIMFNTIKAGIACDWPVMVTGSKLYKTRAGKSDYWALGWANPETDVDLLARLQSIGGASGTDPKTQGVSTNKYKAWQKNVTILQATNPFKQGSYLIRENLRHEAIKMALIPLSASIGGLTNGLEVQGEQRVAGVSPGFYTGKVYLNEIPGMQHVSASWQFAAYNASTNTLSAYKDLNDYHTNGHNLGKPIASVRAVITKAPPPNRGRWDKRIPFEAIINPEKYMKNMDLFDYTAHPSASLDVTASWNGAGNSVYSAMTNNFLAAVPEFFLKDGNFTSIASRPQDELSLYAKAGEVYGMRVKMYRSLNRSRNYSNERVTALRNKLYEVPQDPRDDTDLHETFTMYSRSSAFGYPIFGRTHCIRDHGGSHAGQNAASENNYATASLAVAKNLVTAYQLSLSDIIQVADPSSPTKVPGFLALNDHTGREYAASGVQLIGTTIFHTSSFLATSAGVLDSLEGYNWSYTPPYMHGEAWCDLIFAPQISKTYSMAEIMDSLKMVQRRVDPGFTNPTGSSGEMSPTFIPNGFHSSSLYSAENINANAMQLDSCLNLFGLGKAKTYAYTNVGRTGRTKTGTVRRTVGESPAWIIQPKFETPMLNFSPLSPQMGGTAPRPLEDSVLNLPAHASESVARGIWHQFGTIPQGDEGVWLEVGDIPKNWLDNHPDVEKGTDYAPYNYTGSYALHQYHRKLTSKTMKSLTDLVGMDSTPKRLGELSDRTVVHEAVVAVPFIEKNNQRWFFKIDSHMIDVALGEEDYKLSDNSDQPGSSIEEMILKMDKYVFPPSFDFIRNRDLPAIAMYIFEFSMSFDKDDLSYIWQNLMPPSAGEFKSSSSSITHHLLSNELMGYANKTTGKPMQDKVQWLVFKVKQRAPTNYFEKVIKSTPELDKLSAISRSKQVTFGSNQESTYGYNWPYDHFSIIEMAQIKASVEFSSLPDVPNAVKISSDGGVPTKKGQYMTPVIPGHGLRAPLNPNFGSFGGNASGTGQLLGRAPGQGLDLNYGPRADAQRVSPGLGQLADSARSAGTLTAPNYSNRELQLGRTLEMDALKNLQYLQPQTSAEDLLGINLGAGSSGPIIETDALQYADVFTDAYTMDTGLTTLSSGVSNTAAAVAQAQAASVSNAAAATQNQVTTNVGAMASNVGNMANVTNQVTGNPVQGYSTFSAPMQAMTFNFNW